MRYSVTIDSGKGGTVTRDIMADFAYDAAKEALRLYSTRYGLPMGRKEGPGVHRFEAYDLVRYCSVTIWVKEWQPKL